MVDLHRPKQDYASGATEIASPKTAPLKWLSVRFLNLTHKNPEYNFNTAEEEFVLDILGGLCSVSIFAQNGNETYPEIGGRLNVFGGKPTMVYIPRSSKVHIFAESAQFEGVLISSPATNSHKPALVYPDDTTSKVIGKDNWQRSVVTSIGENVEADRLIVGETTNPPGNWSSAPPHKHDVLSNGEVPMEEVYFYKFNPAQGFGLQRVYSAPGAEESFDVTYAVRDGDAVILPSGYHPVVAAPGYQMMYLWALAGEERKYGAWSDDPEHAWIKGAQ